jgi:hypothetical protein
MNKFALPLLSACVKIMSGTKSADGSVCIELCPGVCIVAQRTLPTGGLDLIGHFVPHQFIVAIYHLTVMDPIIQLLRHTSCGTP